MTNIVTLPTAAAAPPVQRNGPGRNAKNVISKNALYVKRWKKMHGPQSHSPAPAVAPSLDDGSLLDTQRAPTVQRWPFAVELYYDLITLGDRQQGIVEGKLEVAITDARVRALSGEE